MAAADAPAVPEVTDPPQGVDGPGDPPLLEGEADWEAVISQWQFIDRLPDDTEVITLLATLPDIWGIKYTNYAEYVIPLPANTKVKVPRPKDGGGTVQVEEWHEVVTLYFSVAGRLKMLTDAQILNGWRVDIDPEPTVMGPPGFLTELGAEGPLIYRSYITIWDREDRLLGRRSGQASGRGDRPNEKAETAANGRAAAAWGFGVIPGSGIASIEEMRATSGARQSIQAERSARTAVAAGRTSRADLEEDCRTLIEQVRQLRGQERAEMVGKINEYTSRAFGKTVATPEDPEAVDFRDLKDGQIMLLTTQLLDQKRKVETDQADV